MTIWLKQSTASQEVPLGYFLDSTDGDTEETALTIANTDIKIWKTGATTLANKNSGGGTHISNGIYYATLDATDTNTLGPMVLFVHVSGALTVRVPCLVLPANVYDSLVAGTDTLDANVTQWLGTAAATPTVSGVPEVDVTHWAGTAAAAGATAGRPGVDVLALSGDDTAADNIESQYDGTGLSGDNFPATQAQLSNLSVGSGGINDTAESFTATTAGTPTNAYTDTFTLDGTLHIVPPSVGTTDVYYQFDITGTGVPIEVNWDGYMQSNGDTYRIYAYNWAGASWDQIGTRAALNGTTIVSDTWPCTVAHVGTGANLGKVRIRFESTDGTNVATDRLLLSYTSVANALSDAVYVDTANGESGTAAGVGAATRPVDNMTDALTIASNNNLKQFHIYPGSAITLPSSVADYEFVGHGYTVALNGQSIDGTLFVSAETITGTGTNGGSTPKFVSCIFGAVTLPPSHLERCGIGDSSGAFTAGSAGEYIFDVCYSVVAGSGSPTFNFNGLGATTGINNRGWKGGATYVLDSNCTLSHEVAAGGGTTITSGGGDVEVRGICRALTVTMNGTETIQFAGVTGPITLNGTTTATVNLYGVSGSVTDNTTAANVTDLTVNRANIESEADDALVGQKLDHLIAVAESDDPVDNSIIAKLADSGATADWSAFVNTTDSLRAIRDRGDAAWTTGGGGSAPTAAEVADAVWDETLADHLTAGSTGAALNAVSAPASQTHLDGMVYKTGSTYFWIGFLKVDGSVVTSGLSSPAVVGAYGNNAEDSLNYTVIAAPAVGTNHSLYGSFSLGTDPTAGVPWFLEVTVVYASTTYRGRIRVVNAA